MLKYIAALLILSGLVLPLSSCQRYATSEGHIVEFVDRDLKAIYPNIYPPPANVTPIKDLANQGRLPLGIKSFRQYTYFFSGSNIKSASSWFSALALAWPSLALFFIYIVKKRYNTKAVHYITPILLVWSSYELQVNALGGRYEIGYWTTLLGIVLFGLNSAWRSLSGLKYRNNTSTRIILICLITSIGPAIPIYVLVRYH